MLGAAAVDDATLLAMVAERRGLTGDCALAAVQVEEFPYDLVSITTAGRYRVRGVVAEGRRHVPFTFFVKVVQSFARSPLFDVVPPELREAAAASVPWRTEGLAYRSDLGDRLPAGLTMPRAVAVIDLDESSTAIWLDEIAVVERPWDAARYARAAYLLGRLAANPGVAELARVGRLEWTLRTYLAGRLGLVVVPLLLDDAVWGHPLVRSAFDTSLRDRLRAAAASAAELVEEAMAMPHLPAHGDACPNNLLATAGDPDFTLIDYGYWMPAPVGADLGQLLVGNVQIGREPAGDLATRDDALVVAYVAGLRDEGCRIPEGVVRRSHALHHLVMTGLSAVPVDLLEREPSEDLLAQVADRAAIARFCLDRVDATAAA